MFFLYFVLPSPLYDHQKKYQATCAEKMQKKCKICSISLPNSKRYAVYSQESFFASLLNEIVQLAPFRHHQTNRHFLATPKI